MRLSLRLAWPTVTYCHHLISVASTKSNTVDSTLFCYFIFWIVLEFYEESLLPFVEILGVNKTKRRRGAPKLILKVSVHTYLARTIATKIYLQCTIGDDRRQADGLPARQQHKVHGFPSRIPTTVLYYSSSSCTYLHTQQDPGSETVRLLLHTIFCSYTQDSKAS